MLGNPRQYHGTDSRCLGEGAPVYSSERVNFAGHFVMAKCGCGSGCSYLFLWDARTGKLHFATAIGAINIGPYLGKQDVDRVSYTGESFRPNSTLLIIDGCREGTCDCGKLYYVWNGSTFRLVAKEVTQLPPKCRH
jgi:hypothetical protein